MIAVLARSLNRLALSLERAAGALDRIAMALSQLHLHARIRQVFARRRVRIVRTERTIRVKAPLGIDGQLDRLRAIVTAGEATLARLEAASKLAETHLDATAYRLARIDAAVQRGGVGVRADVASRRRPAALIRPRPADRIAWTPLAA